MNTKTKKTATKASACKPGEKVTPGTYMADAEAVLRRLGVAVINYDVGQWLSQQQAARVPIDQLGEKWQAPENAVLAAEARSVARLLYVTEELARKIDDLKGSRQALTAKLQSEKGEKVVDLAVEATESLVETTAQLNTLAPFAEALERRMATDEPPAEIYQAMSRYAYRQLAKTASARGRTTSWKSNAYTDAVLLALGDMASLFLEAEVD